MTVKTWKTNQSKYVMQDRWLSLRADTCTLPNGKQIDPYYVMEIPDWVNIAAFNKNNELLLIHQYRHGCGEVCLELPAGTIEKEDETPIETAKRELLEETGATAENFQIINSFYPNPGRQGTRVYTVTACNAIISQEQILDEHEDIEVTFVSLADVIGMIASNDILVGHTMGSLLQVLINQGLLKIHQGCEKVFSQP